MIIIFQVLAKDVGLPKPRVDPVEQPGSGRIPLNCVGNVKRPINILEILDTLSSILYMYSIKKNIVSKLINKNLLGPHFHTLIRSELRRTRKKYAYCP